MYVYAVQTYLKIHYCVLYKHVGYYLHYSSELPNFDIKVTIAFQLFNLPHTLFS